MKFFIFVWLLFVSVQTHAAVEYNLEPKKVAPDTWVFFGKIENFSAKNGGNIVNTGFVVTEDGVVIIDSGPSLAYGLQMKEAIARVTEKPVLKILITHHHPDHYLGNQAFPNTPIAALPATTALINQTSDDFSNNMYRLIGAAMKGTEVVAPTDSIEPGIWNVGGHRLELIALNGHTDADLAVLDHTTGVLFAGDLAFYNRAPTTPTAELSTWQESLNQLDALDFKILIPGHGEATSSHDAIVQTRDYIQWLLEALTRAAESGSDMAEAMISPLPEWVGKLAVQPGEFKRSVGHLYREIEEQALE